MPSVRNPHHGDALADPWTFSWRHAALGLVLGALLAGGALAAVEWAGGSPDAAPSAPTPSDDPDHAMGADDPCAHMPEHCPPDGEDRP